MCKIADWLVWAMLLLCGIWDWRKKEIPVLFLVGMSIVVSVLVVCVERNMIWHRVAGVGFGILLLGCSKWTKEAIGYGDSWLILLLGAYVGLFRVLQIVFMASLIVGIVSLFCLWIKKWNKKVTIPFVPFLVLSYLGVVCI